MFVIYMHDDCTANNAFRWIGEDSMRSRMLAGAAAMVAAGAICASAAAQTVGIGITRGGELNRIGVAIASVVSAHADGVQMRTQPMAGTQQYIPVVHAGEIEFGLANAFQTYFAYTGTGLSEGVTHDGLRMVATLVPFEIGAFVRNDSDISSYTDLKGRKVAYGFTSAPLMQLLTTAFLRGGGLDWDDVERVPLASLGPLWDLLRQGRVDVASGPVGSGQVRELDATIPGGVRFLSLEDSPESVARLREILPLTYLIQHTPDGGLPGVRSTVNVIGFDMLLWAHKDVPDDIVYRVAKAIYESADELRDTSPVWLKFDRDRMAKDQDMPFHPGATSLYRELGLASR